jgi:hypothetical protein
VLHTATYERGSLPTVTFLDVCLLVSNAQAKLDGIH